MAASVTVTAVIFLTFIALSSARQFPDFSDALTRVQQLSKHAWKDVDSVLSTLYDQQWLQTIDKNTTLQQHLISIISPQCMQDFIDWMTSLHRMEMWAIQS